MNESDEVRPLMGATLAPTPTTQPAQGYVVAPQVYPVHPGCNVRRCLMMSYRTARGDLVAVHVFEAEDVPDEPALAGLVVRAIRAMQEQVEAREDILRQAEGSEHG